MFDGRPVILNLVNQLQRSVTAKLGLTLLQDIQIVL
jgi:hypothetical protein